MIRLPSKILRCLRSRHNIHYFSTKAVLGIETSCDDTGAAIIDANSNKLLGEAINKQQKIHTLHGGINPPIARDLHAANIEKVVSDALRQANLTYKELHAVATTVKPGLSMSLSVGCEYGKRIAIENSLPFIPIHHMEAHALTVRMLRQVDFPFLCLLVSGGHCLLVLCQDIDHFTILGKSIDDAPGEALDKGGRMLNLRCIKELQELSGGAAIERLAQEGNPSAFSFTKAAPMSRHQNCNFSFSSLKNGLGLAVERLEQQHGLDGDTPLPLGVLRDVCASYQHSVFQHIVRRTHRALLYLDKTQAFPSVSRKTLVVSGGVASNQVLRCWLEKLCCKVGGYSLVCPPPPLCTDNGIMVAWNGVERLNTNKGVLACPQQIARVTFLSKCPLGEDISEEITRMQIKVKQWVKM